MRKHQAKQERAKNYKSRVWPEGRDRETSKISCGVVRGKNHICTHTQTLLTPVPRKSSVCLWWSLFPLLPFPGSSSPSKSLLRCSQSHCAPLSSPSCTASTRCAGNNIATDGLLWTVKTKEWLQAAAAKPVSVTSLSLSVCMRRMECHRAYPLSTVDWSSFAKPSLKTCLSHVFGSLSYLNYNPEKLSFSLPRFSIKNKTAT